MIDILRDYNPRLACIMKFMDLAYSFQSLWPPSVWHNCGCTNKTSLQNFNRQVGLLLSQKMIEID